MNETRPVMRVAAYNGYGTQNNRRPWLVSVDGVLLRARDTTGRRFATQKSAERAGCAEVRARGGVVEMMPPYGYGFGPQEK